MKAMKFDQTIELTERDVRSDGQFFPLVKGNHPAAG